MKRPLKNNRPVGPILEFNSTHSHSSNSESEVREFKQYIEEKIEQTVTMTDAKAIKAMDSQMLQSYIINVLNTSAQYSNKDLSIESTIKSSPVKNYANKMGAEKELQRAIQMYN